jgi:hypothetical protein
MGTVNSVDFVLSRFVERALVLCIRPRECDCAAPLRAARHTHRCAIRSSAVCATTTWLLSHINRGESQALHHFVSGAGAWFGGMTNLILRQCADLFVLAVERKDLPVELKLWEPIGAL